MDIKSFCLDYFKNLKEKKNLMFGKNFGNILKNTK